MNIFTLLPAQSISELDQAMLDNDKLFVVLAVVLIIWLGIAWFIYRTDRRIGRLESTLNEQHEEAEPVS